MHLNMMNLTPTKIGFVCRSKCIGFFI